MPDAVTLTSKADCHERRIVELEAQLAALIVERDNLRLAYQNLQHELELMRRRLVVAKAERLDTAQLELEFAHKLAELDALERAQELPTAPPDKATPDEGAGSQPSGKPGGKKRPSTGRRDLRSADLPEERIELCVPPVEGDAEPIGWEESCRVAWRRGSYVRLVVARAKYREAGSASDGPTLVTAPLPHSSHTSRGTPDERR